MDLLPSLFSEASLDAEPKSDLVSLEGRGERLLGRGKRIKVGELFCVGKSGKDEISASWEPRSKGVLELFFEMMVLVRDEGMRN